MNLTVFQPNVGDMVGKAQQIAAQGQQMRQQAQLRDFYAKEGPNLFPGDPTLGKLAAVDPGQAFQLAQFKRAGDQQRMQQFEAIAQRLSKAVLSAPDNVKPAMYAQAVKLLGEQGLDVSRLPQWGPEAQALVSLYAMPAAERTEFERLLSAMSPEEAAKAIRIRAGIEPGADTVFKAETRPAPNAPSGYQWIDPADPSKGVRMIPGIVKDERDDRTTAQKDYDRYAAEEVAAGREPKPFGEWLDRKDNTGLTVYDPATGNPIVSTGPQGRLTEQQSKDLVYANRAVAAIRNLTPELDRALTDFWQSRADSLPFGAGNYLKSDEFQAAEQAAREFLTAILRKDTGAAITNQEFAIYGPMYLPQPGDSAATLQAKRIARERAVEAIKLGLGPLSAYVGPDALPSSAPPETPTAPAASAELPPPSADPRQVPIDQFEAWFQSLSPARQQEVFKALETD